MKKAIILFVAIMVVTGVALAQTPTDRIGAANNHLNMLTNVLTYYGNNSRLPWGWARDGQHWVNRREGITIINIGHRNEHFYSLTAVIDEGIQASLMADAWRDVLLFRAANMRQSGFPTDTGEDPSLGFFMRTQNDTISIYAARSSMIETGQISVVIIFDALMVR